MEEKYEYLWHLVRCGVQDEKARPPRENVDWEAIVVLAGSLRLDTFVKYALKISDGIGCPREIRERAANDVRGLALGRVIAVGELERLQRELLKIGIDSAVLKGAAVGAAYKKPELRTGCDIDLYVAERDEEAVYRWAKSQGHAVRRRVRGAHHGEITHRVLGLIELHVALVSADEVPVKEFFRVYKKMARPAAEFCEAELFGHKIRTLEETEHLVFLVSHMMNHYLHAESTPRMLLDVNAFFAVWHGQIDMERVWGLMETLHYDKFLRAVFGIGVRWLGFAEIPQMRADVEEADRLLADFCQNTSDRQAVMAIYDDYCRRLAPGGTRSFFYKCRLLGGNVVQAFHLLGRLRLRDMARLGSGRIRRVFGGEGQMEAARRQSDVVEERLELMERLGLF